MDGKPMTTAEEAEWRQLFADHPGYAMGKRIMAALDASRAREAKLVEALREARSLLVVAEAACAIADATLAELAKGGQ